MQYFIPVVIFLFGTVLGSFLNVVIFRHNSGRGFGGRSGCLTCARNLEWYELVPIFSYLFIGGKCRKCRTPISFLYPAIELLMGTIFLFLFARFAFFLPYNTVNFFYFVTFYALVFSIMTVIAGYDIRHKIVPNNLVYPLIAFAFFGLFFSDYGVVHFHAATIMSLLSGPIVALPLFLLWAVSGGKWLGFGDVKLSIAIGLLLGIARGFAALILGFWIGAAVALIIIVTKGRKAAQGTQIPFAPFLVVGTLLAFFYDVTITGLMTMFN